MPGFQCRFGLPAGSTVGYNFWLTKLNQFNGNFVNARRWLKRSSLRPNIVTALDHKDIIAFLALEQRVKFRRACQIK